MKNVWPWRGFIVAVILVVLAGLIQNTNALTFWGVKPNLTLVLLITLTFFLGETISYLLLLFLVVVILKRGGGFDAGVLALTVLALASFWFSRKLPGQAFLNNIFLLAAGTLAFYLLTDFRFLGSDFLAVLEEMVYNVILGIVIFFLGARFLKNERSGVTF